MRTVDIGNRYSLGQHNFAAVDGNGRGGGAYFLRGMLHMLYNIAQAIVRTGCTRAC